MKRLFSMLLVLCMVLTLLPGNVFAAQIIDSGECGPKLTWTLDSNYTLTVSGTGEMTERIYSGQPGKAGTVQSVVIESGVTGICDWAFASFTSATSITIPDTVTKIGEAAFYLCRSVSELNLPANLTEIMNDTFTCCYSLKAINIPSHVEKIGRCAFRNCDALERITIPANVKSLGPEAFGQNEKLESVTICGAVTMDESVFRNCESLKNVAIAEGTKAIPTSAFTLCTSLETIYLPSSITEIGESAFYDCRNLSTVEIPSNIQSIGMLAFGNCSKLTQITIPRSVQSLSCSSFKNCFSLQDIYYTGTEAAWNNIRTYNHDTDCPVCKANVHFGSCVAGFSDVLLDEYYAAPVLWAFENEITLGTGKNTFSPDATCTRGQVVTFLWRAKGCPEPKSAVNPFTDVPTDAYYYKAVLWANEAGVTNGTSPTTFSPDAPCTRAHVVTFLWRAENKPAAGRQNPFTDVPAGQYFTDAVLWAVSKNITNGTSPTTFSPESPCTRGQIVTLLYRDMK